MKSFFFSFVFTLALLLGSSLAQNDLSSSLPACSLQCFQQTIAISSCNSTEITCLCGDQQFMGATRACQAKNCTVKEILTSTNATLAACGVPIQDQSMALIAIPASFGSLAMLMVIIRVIGRVWVTKVNLDWDDHLIVAAMICGTILNFVCYPMAHTGMGRDLWAIPHGDITRAFRYLYVAEIFYMVAEMLVQLSLLSFYVRVFPESSHFIRRGSWALMGICTAFGLANTFSMIFQCTPVPFFWNSWAGEMKGICIDINLFSWVRAAIEIAIDVAILSLPLPGIYRLQMNWKKKIQVLFMFSLGFIITAVSCVRLHSLVQFSKTSNPTHDNCPAVYWSVLECNMFIICACMPAMRSILSKLWPRSFGSSAKGSHPSSGYYRQDDSNDRSFKMSQRGEGGKITRSVDVDVSTMHRTGSDEDLVYPPHGSSTTNCHTGSR